MKVGVLPMDESKITMKGRLGPGMMITVDLQNGQVCSVIFLVMVCFNIFPGASFMLKFVFLAVS